MKKLFAAFVTFFVMAAFAASSVFAAGPLYKAQMAEWKDNVKVVEGREFKFLGDPAKLKPEMKEAFKELWDRATAIASKDGLKVTERDKKPFALSPVVKTFFDTKDQQLWKAGWLIRVTTSYKKGYPEASVKVMIKRINMPSKGIFASKLAAEKDLKAKVAIEDNIGINPDGSLYAYLEQGLSFKVDRSALGDMNLADFGKLVPQLLKIGLPADTKLEAIPAFGTRCRPGFIALPGLEKPVAVSMEAWARTENGKPFVYDYSFGYDGDFDKMGVTHEAAEKFTISLYKDMGPSLGFENAAKWGGSKVRVLLGQPREKM